MSGFTKRPMPEAMLSEAEFERIDEALGTVVERPGDFTSFQVDFAMDNASRLGRFLRRTRFTPKQREVIAAIEQRIAALDAEG